MAWSLASLKPRSIRFTLKAISVNPVTPVNPVIIARSTAATTVLATQP